MAYVVTAACVKCKYSDCVAVCPVDCFYELDEMLVINPDECIDCGACEAECPTTAIFEEAEVPYDQEAMTDFNAVASGAMELGDSYYEFTNLNPSEYENIFEMQEPLPNADEYRDSYIEVKKKVLTEKYNVPFNS